jgi:hypothetical protein
MSIKVYLTTQVVVWAGSDIYAALEMQDNLAMSREEMYSQVSKEILPHIIEDFGEGAELIQDERAIYHISVDKVPIS